MLGQQKKIQKVKTLQSMNIRASTYYNQMEKFVQAHRFGFDFKSNLHKGIGVLNDFIRSLPTLNKRLPSKESKLLQD